MNRFSKRYGFDPRTNKEEVLEDAPETLRRLFAHQILLPLTYIDGDSRYANNEGRPLGIKSLYEEFCILCRTEPDESIWDSWQSWEVLRSEVQSAPWYHFYDLIELIAGHLKRRVPPSPFDELNEDFGFPKFREDLNALLQEEGIGWRLSEEGRLSRNRPAALNGRMQDAEKSLQDQFTAARAHYRKAVRYLYQHPVDAENSIKEIVSAVESAARVLYPGSSTLGAAIKLMRSDPLWSPGIVSTIEKFYAFASSEPAVRHGAPAESTLGLDEAELSLHMGIAMIRYLVGRSKNADGKATT